MKLQRDTKLAFAVLLLMSTFLGAVGQLFLKLALLQSIMLFLSVLLAVGIVFYVSSTVVYLYVLGRMHLSWVYSFGGLSYIFASIFAWLVLAEGIDPLRWAGIIVIAIGTAIVGLS